MSSSLPASQPGGTPPIFVTDKRLQRRKVLNKVMEVISTLAALLADDGQRLALGNAARTCIAASFTSSQQAKRLGALYAERLGR